MSEKAMTKLVKVLVMDALRRANSHAEMLGIELKSLVKHPLIFLALCVSAFSPCAGANYTISPSNPSCKGRIQGGPKINQRDSCTISVPNGMYADVRYSTTRTDLRNCNHSSINFSYNPVNGDTIRFYSNDSVDVYVEAYDPEIAWTEVIELPNGWLSAPIYHYYESYYAEYEYTISAEYIQLQPDLVVKSASAIPNIARQGESVTISFRISNIGNAPADSSLAAIYCDGTLVANKVVPALSQSEEASFSYTFAEGFTEEKNYSITIKANYDESLTETSAANNSRVPVKFVCHF